MIPSIFLLLCSTAAIAQPESLVVPPAVVQDSASQIALKPDSTACDHACASLASRLPSSLFLARTGNFNFWDAKQSDLTPACRVEPSTSEEVAFVLKTLTDARCHFAIKSGGHDRTPGSSNADGGVTIDLVRLNHVKVSEDRQSVTIGAGLLWVDVYRALEKENLAVPGGRVHDVGVGGLILGGGLSFFANRYGWACDNVLSYEIVLPNSTVETITPSSRPDLYRSLRGAGASNFGIVTSFTMEAIAPSNPAGVWRGFKSFSWDKVPELLKLNYKVATESMDLDPDVAVINLFLYSQVYGQWFGYNMLTHLIHTDPSTWPESFQPYERLEGVPHTTFVGVKPLSNITVDAGQGSPHGDRNVYGTFTYHPSLDLDRELVELFKEEGSRVHDVPEAVLALSKQPISRSAIKHMKKRGGNALGIADSGETGPLVVLGVMWKWTHASDDERIYAAYHRFMDKAEAAAKRMGLWHPYKYINYAEATQDVWTGYGEQSLKELRRVQRQLDPDGVFAKGGLAGGYFKLNDMPHKQTTHGGKAKAEWTKGEL